MKKLIPLIPVLLCPYAVVLCVVSIFTGVFMETLFHNSPGAVVGFSLVMYAAAFVCSVTVMAVGLAGKWSAVELLRVSMVVKLLHIPAYLAFFAAGLICLFTIFTFAFSFLLLALAALTMLVSGLAGLTGIIRGAGEKKLSGAQAVLHGFLQFIFCLDVVSSVIVYRKVKAASALPSTNGG